MLFKATMLTRVIELCIACRQAVIQDSLYNMVISALAGYWKFYFSGRKHDQDRTF